jgi:hypothetical protein
MRQGADKPLSDTLSIGSDGSKAMARLIDFPSMEVDHRCHREINAGSA